jgi:hypothetical protein
MKNILILLGLILLLGVLIFSFVSIIKRIIRSIKVKNYQAMAFDLLILLIAVALCVFLIKPVSMTEKVIGLFK